MALSANEKLDDEAIDHAITLTRYSNHVVAQMVALLNKSDARLTAALAEALMQMERESFTVARLEALLESVREINAEAYRALYGAIQGELEGLAAVEAGYQMQLFSDAVPSAVRLQFGLGTISQSQVYAAAMARPFQGRLLRDWFGNLEQSRMQAITNAVRNGFVEGQTTAEIVQAIRGTRANKHADGVLQKPRREVEAVVRTAISHTAQIAQNDMIAANADLVKAVKWSSTLDDRTTHICAIRDGKLYTADDKRRPIDHKIPWGEGPGRIHFCCRSAQVPVLKSWRDLGLDMDDMPAGTRASMDGQVPADQTYGQWLAKQSLQRQEDVLGVERAQLFRSGKLSFDKFYNERGKFLTLAQLRLKYGLP